MNERKRSCTLPSLVLALGLCRVALAEFKPDEHTLFLAHFNETALRADYAQGISLFAGNGARLTDGYYGKGLDLHVRGLHERFMETCEDFTPEFNGWGFHPRGNADPWQGTFECWVLLADPKTGKTPYAATLFNAYLGRSVKHPTRKGEYAGFSLTLSKSALRHTIPTVAGGCFDGEAKFKAIRGFEKDLDPNEWHHFALTWSQGESVMWLDGRPLATFDMTGQHGLAIFGNPVRHTQVANCVVDELRFSNVVRYTQSFEPGWRDGKQPDYAFPGNPDAKRYDAKLIPAPAPKPVAVPAGVESVKAALGEFALEFSKSDGSLIGLRIGPSAATGSANGLLLHRGLERQPLSPRAMRDYRVRDGRVRFEQSFDGDVAATQEITEQGGALIWKVTLTNAGGQEAWLEPLLSIPVPLDRTDEFFDGCEPRRVIHLPRHRDEYASTLPFVAASGGGRFVGVGIDPHIGLSDIVSEWIPVGGAGIIRQGTKVALLPGESFAYEFRVVQGRSDFGALDAIAAFHAQFPDLYHLRPDVPVYSYMPATQHWEWFKSYMDMNRVGYAGGFWGHGPGSDKGDEFGTPRWWDDPKLDADMHYRTYTRRIHALWGNIYDMRELIHFYYQRSYDNFYPVRRFHTCPDMTPEYIIKDVWPGHVPNEDPLCFGQYYGPIWNAYLVNEYRTPIGDHFCEQTRQYYRQMKGSSPGFINDMSHAGALYRHNDPIAQRTPGRSFARDLGPFVRKALGRQQRYEVANSFVDNGHRASFWSDGGSFSYTLGAFSAAMAIEGAGMYTDLTGPGEYVVPARYLVGEKPFTAMTHLNDDYIGYQLKPDMFSPETLRDYYRYCDSQLALFCIEHGVTLDPTSYMWGRQISLELAPIMVESTVLGRKVVPAARVDEPLWVRRAGNGLDTFLVVGNRTPTARRTDVQVVNRYFAGAPLFAAYYGGETTHTVTDETSTIRAVEVSPRSVAAFKAVATLNGIGSASTRFSGDGLTLQLELSITAPNGGEVLLTTFGPLYEVRELLLNGKPARHRPGDPLGLAEGTTQIRASYQNRSLAFSADDWKAVDLVKDGRTNFCLVADRGVEYKVRAEDKEGFALGFERGTANMLNEFLEVYDYEDGQLGNLKPAEFVDKRSEDYPGWTVVLSHAPTVKPGRVRIDRAKREIRVEGATQGEMRRAMVTLLRLVDRKYPHVGRFFPLHGPKKDYAPGQPVPIDEWVPRKQTQEFYKGFSDPLFLVKPILRPEYETLYRDGNMDFAGKYQMRWSPYLFEPTYGDDFVYGYTGPGWAETKEELQRKAPPFTQPK